MISCIDKYWNVWVPQRKLWEFTKNKTILLIACKKYRKICKIINIINTWEHSNNERLMCSFFISYSKKILQLHK